MDTADDTQARGSEPFEYGSADGRTRIHALRWTSVGAPKGVVQLVHGMTEHIARYDDFARFLAAHGYEVCGNDHIGHGSSARSIEELSQLPANGAQVMIADVHTLRTITQKRLGSSIPYIMFGHSMGSFIVRVYLARYATGLAGAVISGTAQVPVAAARLGADLARRGIRRKGNEYTSSFLNSLADGAYSKQIKNARTHFDWLNTDPAEVDAFIDDPFCGKMFNLGGYASLFDLTAESASAQTAAAVPDGFPVLFVAGEQDPVGDSGAGVRAAAKAMSALSKAQVRTIIYPQMRHEILKEPERQRVYDDVLGWLEDVVAACHESQRAGCVCAGASACEDEAAKAQGPSETIEEL